VSFFGKFGLVYSMVKQVNHLNLGLKDDHVKH